MFKTSVFLALVEDDEERVTGLTPHRLAEQDWERRVAPASCEAGL